MTGECHLLFVYGTLKRRSRHPMAKFLAERGKHLGEAKIAARLYDLGRYPGMISSTQPDEWVYGDLYGMSAAAAAMAELDRYEGDESPGEEYFDRQLAEVECADGSRVEAWVYWYRGRVRDESRIPSGRYEGNMQ